MVLPSGVRGESKGIGLSIFKLGFLSALSPCRILNIQGFYVLVEDYLMFKCIHIAN